MYPKKVNKFIPWSRAMVAGATVGNPDYGKARSKTGYKTKTRKRKRRRRKKNAKKD